MLLKAEEIDDRGKDAVMQHGLETLNCLHVDGMIRHRRFRLLRSSCKVFLDERTEHLKKELLFICAIPMLCKATQMSSLMLSLTCAIYRGLSFGEDACQTNDMKGKISNNIR